MDVHLECTEYKFDSTESLIKSATGKKYFQFNKKKASKRKTLSKFQIYPDEKNPDEKNL